MKWVKPPIDGERVRAVADAHSLDLLTAAILTRREMTEPEQIAFFLEDDERFLHNPFLFPQMERAIERVLAAAEEDEKVLVCGDKDADGITATVLMVEALRSVGIEPDWRVPLGDENYGLNSEVLEAKAAEDFTLVITVDCGITEFDEIELAGQLGMDVLIFDHHLPRENQLPAALAIVNPKIPGAYPFEGLCAAAVVSKFQWALCLAGTELWSEEFCFIRAAGGDDSQSSVVMEALKMRNLTEIQRIRVSMDEGEIGREKVLRFIEGLPLFTYGQAAQVPLVSKFFGGADVHVIDIEPDVSATFPGLKGQLLEDLETRSRLARYFSGEGDGIATLGNLAVTLYSHKFSAAFDPWRRGLDLVAIATLADLMPLVDENRILVGLGLNRLNAADGTQERRSALRALLIHLRLNEGRIDNVETSWQICPLVNASGRMGRADVGVELLLTADSSRIAVLADELVNLNKKRRELGEQFWERLHQPAYQAMEALGGRMSIVADEGIPRGITGILALRLQRALGVTVVVISRRGKIASGSIRCDSEINAVTWLEAMAPLLDDYGGHSQAGGFQLDSGKIDSLMANCREWIRKNSLNPLQEDPIRIDAELPHSEFDKLGLKGLESLLGRLEPYGNGFPPLTFLTRSVRIHSASLVGKPRSRHLKLLVSLGSAKWPALWWDAADRYGADIRIDTEVDLVYHIDRDRWRGVDARRLTILEATPCAG